MVAEASCPGDWRVARIWGGRRRLTPRLPCVTSPADTQPLGNRLGLDCCRRHGRPAGYHVGGSGPPPSAAAAASPPHGPARAGACSSHDSVGPDRHFRLVAKPAPPRLYSSSVGLAAAGFNKGIPFLSGCEAAGAPAASTHCRGGGRLVEVLQGARCHSQQLNLLQRRSSFLFVSAHASSSSSSSSSGHKGSN